MIITGAVVRGWWPPGETLLIDSGLLAEVHVFCAVLGWSRFRFVRLADNEKASATFELLAECFEVLGGVPLVVLADRMGCLEAGVVAIVVVPTAYYVALRDPLRVPPDFCNGADPQSKGMVENLVGYAKKDLMVPQQPFTDLWTAAGAAEVWCMEVNATLHSEIAAVPLYGSRRSGSCCGRCRRCAPRSSSNRSHAMSTGCPISGSGRPATWCRAG